MSGLLERRARRVAAIRGASPEERIRIREEVLDHLREAAAEYRSIGIAAARAERLAIDDFGDLGKVRKDLRRAMRGRPIVLFPDQPGQRLAHFVTYDLKAVVAILIVVILLRLQVVAAYHIPTQSMEPTLHGDQASGDKILVNKLYYDFGDPQRFDVAVFEIKNDDVNYIKRIVGLPGELLEIRNGDVYSNGAIVRKPREVQDDLLVPVYLDGRDRRPGREEIGLAAWERGGTWSEEGDRFACVADHDGRAFLRFTGPIPEPVGSCPHVGDLVVSFVVEASADARVVGAVLREGRDLFDLRIPVGGGDLVLERNKDEAAGAPGVFLTPGVPAHVRFANLDDRVTVEIDGREVLSWDVPDADSGRPSDAPAAEVGILGGGATFTEVALHRDIHYYREARNFPFPYRVPDGHYFMMGDNSGNSTDSRVWGPVPRENLIGRAMVVFWPPSRMKVVR